MPRALSGLAAAIALSTAALTFLPGSPPAGAAGPAAVVAPVEERPVRIMPLGDSITYGVGTPERDSYRTTLHRWLTEVGTDVDFVGSMRSGTGPDPDNEGHPGWTVDQIAEHIDEWIGNYEPDVILLHIGTNDVYRDIPGTALRLDALLERIAVGAPDAQVFVAQVVGMAGRNAGRQARHAEYNAEVAAVVEARGGNFHLVDQSVVQGADLTDLVHPNASGYHLMAATWFESLAPYLSAS